MQPPCPHCDPPGLTSLRLVLIGALFCADEPLLLRLAAVMQQGDLLLQRSPTPEAPASTLGQARKATRHALQQPGKNSQ
jgi:hypothetical protein